MASFYLVEPDGTADSARIGPLIPHAINRRATALMDRRA
jgi:hypothetical protein